MATHAHLSLLNSFPPKRQPLPCHHHLINDDWITHIYAVELFCHALLIFLRRLFSLKSTLDRLQLRLVVQPMITAPHLTVHLSSITVCLAISSSNALRSSIVPLLHTVLNWDTIETPPLVSTEHAFSTTEKRTFQSTTTTRIVEEDYTIQRSSLQRNRQWIFLSGTSGCALALINTARQMQRTPHHPLIRRANN